MKAWLWMVVAGVSLARGEIVPTEEFARDPDFRQMQLSPDGQYVAFLRGVGDQRALFLLELKKMQPARVDPGELGGTKLGVNRVRWISDTRLLYHATIYGIYHAGTCAIDRDGRRPRYLTGAVMSLEYPLDGQRVLHAFREPKPSVLVLDNGRKEGSAARPDVVRLDTLSGSYEAVVKNPGNVLWWETDFDGNVRVGYTFEKDAHGIIYRESSARPWRNLPALPEARGEILPLQVFEDGALGVVAISDKGFWSPFRYDTLEGKLSAPLAEEEGYDILVPPNYDFSWPIFSPRKRALAGLRYVADGPRTRWLDPEFAALQATIDASLRNTVNEVANFSRDEQQVLILAHSDKDPGTYYIFDRGRKQLRLLTKVMSGIKPELMSDMYPIKYQARDGILIRGYLTVPRGEKPEGLPLVMMPHGGPWARDVWEFDPLVQLLAARGYAVLQVNFRGSLGYGVKFAELGRREFGGTVQRDIEDGARWAIAQGIADRDRVAIIGASFGGYSVLYGLGKTTNLYRCGIALAAVTDWAPLIKRADNEEHRFAYRHWVEQLGDPKLDRAALDAISPVNFANDISAPLLLIHGREDRTVPLSQAKKMVSALEKVGRPPATLYFFDEGHSISDEKNRITAFKRIESFLAQHMGKKGASAGSH